MPLNLTSETCRATEWQLNGRATCCQHLAGSWMCRRSPLANNHCVASGVRQHEHFSYRVWPVMALWHSDRYCVFSIPKRWTCMLWSWALFLKEQPLNILPHVQIFQDVSSPPLTLFSRSDAVIYCSLNLYFLSVGSTRRIQKWSDCPRDGHFILKFLWTQKINGEPFFNFKDVPSVEQEKN